MIDDSWTATRADGGSSYALVYNNEVGYSWWAPRADEHAMDTYLLGYGDNYKRQCPIILRFQEKFRCLPIMSSDTGIVSMLLIRHRTTVIL